MKTFVIFTICLLLLNNSNLLSQLDNSFNIVKSLHPCDNTIVLKSNTKFEKGDLVLLIQMNGAKINTSNNNLFGDIQNLNGAGQFELNEIALEIDAKSYKLKYQIKANYDFNSNIQLIKVKNQKNLTINSNPEIQAWDGEKGGVLVLYAEDTLIINSNIDVSGKGFNGGEPHNSKEHRANNEQKYFYPLNDDLAGNKGEGISLPNDNYGAGRGKNANGGGGGNAHNAGGGGGGNFAFGGLGGEPYKGYGYSIDNQGIGGGISINHNLPYPVILGGGGGSGHYNDKMGSDGAAGGGIVFIFAKVIKSNNTKIISNGSSVTKITGIDACGGGGAGGTIFINFEECLSEIKIEANGGFGGSSRAYGYDGNVQSWVCVGPGGGGGGGTLFLNKESNLISSNLMGGKSGIMLDGADSCKGNGNGASDGNIGFRLIYNSILHNDIKPENSLFYFMYQNNSTCDSINVVLSVEPKNKIKEILWNTGASTPNIEVYENGKYSCEIIDILGCRYLIDTNVVDVFDNQSLVNTEYFNTENFKVSGNPKLENTGILLTDNKENQRGAVWLSQMISLKTSFSSSFGFRVFKGNNNKLFEPSFPGADGFALVFQNFKENPIGQNGGGIGYAGIKNALAIELDLFENTSLIDSIFDPNGNHLAIFSSKDGKLTPNHNSENLIKQKEDIMIIEGDSSLYFFNVEFDSDSKILNTSISRNAYDFANSLSISKMDFSEYISLYRNEFAYIGITSATGSAVEAHQIENWNICADFLSTTSVENITERETIQVENGNLSLYVNDKIFSLIRIYDYLGRVVLTQELEKTHHTNLFIDIDFLNDGVYLIELSGGNEILRRYFFKSF